MIDLLASRGADANAGFGRSALENALWHAETEAGHALLRHGAKIDLRLAAGLGRIDLMEEYFEEDGSLRKGAYALAPPVGEGCKLEISDIEVLADAMSVATLNWQFDAIDFLLEKGADINACSRFVIAKVTPLHFACWLTLRDRTEPTMIAFLLDRGADPMVKDDPSGPHATPFQWAIENGRTSFVMYMLDRGGCSGDLNDHLCHAAQRGHVEVARVFVEAGADSSQPCRDGKSAIQLAQEEGNTDMVVFLQGQTKSEG